jgi:hypothetical protein
VCSLWTCDSSRLDSTCGDSSSSTGSSDESSIMEKHSQHHEIGERDNEHAEADTFVPRTKGETLYQDLPPVECCDAQFPNDGRLLPVATVSHYTEKLCEFVLFSEGRSLPLMLSLNDQLVGWSTTLYMKRCIRVCKSSTRLQGNAQTLSAAHIYQHCTHTHVQVS